MMRYAAAQFRSANTAWAKTETAVSIAAIAERDDCCLSIDGSDFGSFSIVSTWSGGSRTSADQSQNPAAKRLVMIAIQFVNEQIGLIVFGAV